MLEGKPIKFSANTSQLASSLQQAVANGDRSDPRVARPSSKSFQAQYGTGGRDRQADLILGICCSPIRAARNGLRLRARKSTGIEVRVQGGLSAEAIQELLAGVEPRMARRNSAHCALQGKKESGTTAGTLSSEGRTGGEALVEAAGARGRRLCEYALGQSACRSTAAGARPRSGSKRWRRL